MANVKHPMMSKHVTFMLAKVIRDANVPEIHKRKLAWTIARWIATIALFNFDPKLFVIRCCGDDSEDT